MGNDAFEGLFMRPFPVAFVCQVAVLWITAQAQPACNGITRAVGYGSSCYVFSDIKTNWTAAERRCVSRGGHLASVPNVATQNFLETELRNRSWSTSWLGGQEIHGPWRWVVDEDIISSQGCYTDKSFDRDLLTEIAPAIYDLTPDKCVAACRNMSKLYAGVQNQLSCFCGNSFGKYGATEGCTVKCEITKTQYCGGFGRNFIYQIGASYANWATGQPNDKGGYQTCAAIDFYVADGDFSDEVCSTPYRYVCTVDNNVCNGANQTKRNGICYFISTDTRTWHEARAQCVAMSGDLLKVSNDSVHRDIKNILRNQNVFDKFYIGLASGVWKWSSDGQISALVYSKWRSSAPSQRGATCLKLIGSSGNNDYNWIDASCTEEHKYICEIERASTTTVLPSTTAIPSTTATPTTTAIPSTTATPSTTAIPSTTTIPTTTVIPSTNATSSTAAILRTTTTPSTTSFLGTNPTSSITAVPSTTATPNKPAISSITAIPTTTANPSGVSTTGTPVANTIHSASTQSQTVSSLLTSNASVNTISNTASTTASIVSSSPAVTSKGATPSAVSSPPAVATSAIPPSASSSATAVTPSVTPSAASVSSTSASIVTSPVSTVLPGSASSNAISNISTTINPNSQSSSTGQKASQTSTNMFSTSPVSSDKVSVSTTGSSVINATVGGPNIGGSTQNESGLSVVHIVLIICFAILAVAITTGVILFVYYKKKNSSHVYTVTGSKMFKSSVSPYNVADERALTNGHVVTVSLEDTGNADGLAATNARYFDRGGNSNHGTANGNAGNLRPDIRNGHAGSLRSSRGTWRGERIFIEE